MGKFSKIALGLNVVAIICVLVALIVDVLSYYEDSFSGIDVSGTFGASDYTVEISGSSADITYEEGCNDYEVDEYCDLQGRGVAWIIFNVIAMILGIIAAVADFGIAQVSFGGISNKFLPIIAGVCVLVGILIWEIDNPAYDDNSEFEAGASIFIAAVGLVFFLIAGGLEFAPDA